MNTLLFQNKYRVKSTRLEGWDYTNSGMYSVTICTKDRQCYFGDIKEGKMILSEVGEIAQQYWLEIPRHYPIVLLDEYVVMPNHIHGIIVINRGRDEAMCGRDEALPRLYNVSPKPNSLSSIIGSYKSICTKHIHKSNNPNFNWQPRFYDHIIRNEKSLDEIRRYICNNPLKWEFDGNNPENTVETRML